MGLKLNDLISVIIPIYNSENYLENCLNSIQKQDYKYLNIVLVNDGSTDASLLICQKFARGDNRFVIVNEKNLGQAVARNEGIKRASGKFISFVDSDDIVSKNYISNLYNGLKIGGDIAISNKRRINFTENVRLDEHTQKKLPKIAILPSKIIIKKMLSKKIGLEAWGKLYPISYFDNISYPVGQYYEDAEITCLLINKAEKISYIHSQDYFYFKRENSLINQKFSYKKLDILKMGNKLSNFIFYNYPDLHVELAEKLFSAYTNVWMQMKPQESKYNYLWNKIVENRKVLILHIYRIYDFKTLLGILISFFGKKRYRYIYDLLNNIL